MRRFLLILHTVAVSAAAAIVTGPATAAPPAGCGVNLSAPAESGNSLGLGQPPHVTVKRPFDVSTVDQIRECEAVMADFATRTQPLLQHNSVDRSSPAQRKRGETPTRRTLVPGGFARDGGFR